MTKRDIIKFLERKMNEKRNAVSREYQKAHDQEMQNIYEELGLPALAEEMQPLLQKACDLWDSWMAKHEGCEGLTITSYYYSLLTQLIASTESEDATFKKLICEHIKVERKALDSIVKQSNLEVECVIATFTTVISTVRQMKFTKEAAAYVKELGFDLSELEKSGDQAQTALTVPVDARYLFVKAA